MTESSSHLPLPTPPPSSTIPIPRHSALGPPRRAPPRAARQAIAKWDADSAETSGLSRDMKGPQGQLRILCPIEDYVVWFDEAKTSRQLACGDKTKNAPKDAGAAGLGMAGNLR